MKLDLFFELEPPPGPWASFPDGQRAAEQQVIREAIAQVQHADKFGFATAWFVEHHFRLPRSVCAAPEVLLGGLALSTSNIRLGFGVTLLPFGFTHPARVAEKVAMVDVLSGGRVEWGTGRSTPMEQHTFGVPLGDEGRRQWREAVKIVVEMWRSEMFSWDSPDFQMPERYVTPKPVQAPHPPCWVAGGSASTLTTASRNGLGWLAFSPLASAESMAGPIEKFREGQKDPLEPLTDVYNDRMGTYTLVHCCDDLDEARRYGIFPAVESWYRSLIEFELRWEIDEFEEAQKRRFLALLEPGAIDAEAFLAAGNVIVGTPDQCLQQMLQYADIGVDHLLCYQQFGGIPHERIMRSIELLGTKVIPELEARGHRNR